MITTQRNGEAAFGDAVWDLPPLILHPFADRASSQRLVENSRHALLAMLPSNGSQAEDLARKRLEGRFAEVRMLYYLGKDVTRWIGQCVELSERVPELSGMGVREQSFANLLTRHMPEAVGLKLQGWGVHDAGVIFARAIGLNQVFSEPPQLERLAENFVRSYHHYADAVYTCWQQLTGFRQITCANFRFDLYASGEYTKMLETEWGTSEESD
jgi:hypothetical protein